MYLTNHTNHSDICVVGGGIVGLAIGIGLLRNGMSVTILDDGDHALRASRGNFGLVWVQGKGDTQPDYARVTRTSAKLWYHFSETLQSETGIDIELQQKGGLHLCLSEQELEQRTQMLNGIRQANLIPEDYLFSTLDLQQVREFIPEAGPEVCGATWCPEDGHLNPLHLLRAMTELFLKQGGQLAHQGKVIDIQHQGNDFTLVTEDGSHFHSAKVVLAAGLGSKDLAGKVGLNAPLEPNRGQVLITERLNSFLHYPTGHIRQTGEGTIQIGDSKEDVGFNKGTTLEVMTQIAARARKMLPMLDQVKLIRAWGALRIMTPDGVPIYEESECCPGAFLVTCHSGVTLGAFHSGPVADWICGIEQPLITEAFHASRFSI